jgi:hypothetical protein
MDVGLNNTNRLHEALDNDFMKDIEWIVEATSNERHELWRKYHNEDTRFKTEAGEYNKDGKYIWEEVSSGHGCTIASVVIDVTRNGKTVKETLPLHLNFSYAIINGHKIAFYDTSSLLAHHGIVEAFLITYFQRTHDNYSRWNHTNADNFHNCIGYLDTIDKEPRNSIYTGNKTESGYMELFESQSHDTEYVTNLTVLNTDTLIKDHHNRIFIINELKCEGKYVKILLSELTNDFRSWECTLPMTCDENKFFVSPNDSDFKFRFESIEYTKKDICKTFLSNIIL